MGKNTEGPGFPAGRGAFRKLAGLMFIAAVLLVFLVSPFFAVTELEINGTSRVSTEEITAAGVSEGQNFFLMTSGGIERKLSALPYVKGVTVRKFLPGRVVLDIAERVPRAYIKYDNMGIYLLMDEDGVVLDVQEQMIEELPLVTGIGFDKFVEGEPLLTGDDAAFASMLDISRLLARYEIGGVSEVNLADVKEIRLVVNGVDVSFGSVEGGDEKIRFMQAVMAELPEAGQGTLDLRSGGIARFSHR